MAKKKSNINTGAGEEQDTAASEFIYDGKKYKATKPAIIPLANGAETLTASDICVSEEAQEYLVKNGCTCIEEVIE